MAQYAGLSMTNIRILLALATATALTPAAVISFDDRVDGNVITTQYPDVTFDSGTGGVIVVGIGAPAVSPPNVICGHNAGACDALLEIRVTFSRAANNVSFWAIADNNFGVIGKVDVFAGATLLGTSDILGDGNTSTHVLNDLSAYANVTGIRIHSITDLGGLGYDNFSFELTAVPEPSTVGLAALGLLWCRLGRRMPTSQ